MSPRARAPGGRDESRFDPRDLGEGALRGRPAWRRGERAGCLRCRALGAAGPRAGRSPPACSGCGGGAHSLIIRAPAQDGSCMRAISSRRSSSQPSGHSTSPSTWTSGSSTTPKLSWTRRRPPPSARGCRRSSPRPRSRRSSRASRRSARRRPACPRHPAASSSWPAVRPSARGSSSGFLKVEPKVLIPDGCASRRCRASRPASP